MSKEYLKSVFKDLEEYVFDNCENALHSGDYHGVPKRDCDFGFQAYFALDDYVADEISALLQDNPYKEQIVERINKENLIFKCGALADFILDAKRDGTAEISDACFDNASVLEKLSGEKQEKLFDTILSSLDEETESAFVDWLERVRYESGFFQLNMTGDLTEDNHLILDASFNFDCPYYRSDAAIAHDCGPLAARETMTVSLAHINTEFPKDAEKAKEIVTDFIKFMPEFELKEEETDNLMPSM